MAQGKKFNLTENRLTKVIGLLKKQYSVMYCADQLGIDATTLSSKLTELKIDTKALKREGINTMKADLVQTIGDIGDPKDNAKATLDFLKHYDKSDDVADPDKSNRQGVGDLYKAINGN